MSILKSAFGVVRSETVSKVFSYTQVLQKCVTPVQVVQARQKSTNKYYGSSFGFSNWQQKKDFNRRECVRNNFAERMRINAIRKNRILPVEIREAADKQVKELPRDSNPVRLVDRCVFTSRARGLRKKYRVSRIVFRDFADHGQVSGVKHAKW